MEVKGILMKMTRGGGRVKRRDEQIIMWQVHRRRFANHDGGKVICIQG